MANQSGTISSPPVLARQRFVAGERVRGEGKLMLWLYRLIYPTERYIWAQIRILHETDKAILVENGMKIWIPKSRIHGIRLRKNVFEIYVKESTMG